MNGVSFASKQGSAVPNITGSFSGHNNWISGAFQIISGSEWHGNRDNNRQKRGINFDANRCSNVYQNVNEARPQNRNYLPIIKLG